MVAPTRCLSSYATQALLEFRNPQGSDENWIDREENINNYFVHIGKVAITEIGIGVLCCTSLIESIAYTILLPRCSGVLDLELVNKIIKLSKSSFFTLAWNLGNLFINPFCTNLVTNESIARFSSDNWPRGNMQNVIVSIAIIAASVFLFTTLFVPGELLYNFLLGTVVVTLAACFIFDEGKYFRIEDAFYVENWHRRVNRVVIPNIPLDLRIDFWERLLGDDGILPEPRMIGDERMWIEPNEPEGVNEASVNRGINFFKKYILNDGQIDAETREAVVNIFPIEACLFALSRLVYACVFIEPGVSIDFFQPDTRTIIETLRRNNLQNRRAVLAPYMSNLNSFNEGTDDALIRPLFNKIKEAALRESQGGMFVQRCYQNACAEYLRTHPHQE